MEQSLKISRGLETQPKRLLLYAHYDRDGRVDPHVIYQIKALYEFGITIIFISNSPVSEEDSHVLYPFIKKLHVRPDEGYDWTAWKETIFYLGVDVLSKYDELIIMNDSCYGPIFPLEEIFLKMNNKNVDFWGITENTDPNYIDHIQPYFCVFRKSVFNNKLFMQFWESFGILYTYMDAVNNCELRMTKYLVDCGYRYATYINMENMAITPQVGVEHPFIFSISPWLIQKFRVPFIKVKSFRTSWNKQYNMGQELFSALEKCGSTYSPQLIWDHLRRTRPISWQKNLPGTLVEIDKNAEVYPDPRLKIAVFAHLFYLDQVEESIKWIGNIPYLFDLYISTSSNEKAEEIKRKILGYAGMHIGKFEIRVMEDRGRDVAPWLLGFKDIQGQYDLALKFHMKKRPEPNAVFIDQWNDSLMQNTLASPGYVSSIIREFINSEKLGLMFHIIPHVLVLYFSNLESDDDILWKNRVFKRLSIFPPEETSQAVFPNNIFWYRPKALEKLFSSNITIDDFPPEPFPVLGTIAHGLERAIPYIAQASGYFYKMSVTKQYSITILQHYEDKILFSARNSENKKDVSCVYFDYYLIHPRKIPIGRAFQISLLSLYGYIFSKDIHILKNIEKKLIRYCTISPLLIPFRTSFYVALLSLLEHIIKYEKNNKN